LVVGADDPAVNLQGLLVVSGEVDQLILQAVGVGVEQAVERGQEGGVVAAGQRP